MTFQDWLSEQPKSFWGKPLVQKLEAAAAWGRREGRWEIERQQTHQYKQVTPANIRE